MIRGSDKKTLPIVGHFEDGRYIKWQVLVNQLIKDLKHLGVVIGNYASLSLYISASILSPLQQ